MPIPLGKLNSKFPQELNQQISGFVERTQVYFPCERLGHALKSGKVFFTWQELKSWMKPKASFGANSWDATKLDVPLKAIVGPFMAAMRDQEARKSRQPAAEPEPAPAAAPAVPEPQSADTPEEPEPSTAPAPVEEKPSPRSELPPKVHLGELLGAPEKTEWTPVEIVQRVAGLPGIAGAIISLAAGQVAAAEVDSAIKADLVAFRVPKIFDLTAEQVAGMELESVGHVSFTSGGTPWLVFKLGNIFFTVQGRAGDLLPVARLQSIALEIGRQRK